MTSSDKTVTINLMTMLVSFPECPQAVEGMHDSTGEDFGGVDTFYRGIASLYVAGLGGGAAMARDRMALPSVHWETLLELKSLPHTL